MGTGNASKFPRAAFTDLPYKCFLNCQFIHIGRNLCSCTLYGHASPVVTSVRFACAALHLLAQCILNIPYIFAIDTGPNSGNLWAYFAHARAYQSHDLHYNLIVPYTPVTRILSNYISYLLPNIIKPNFCA